MNGVKLKRFITSKQSGSINRLGELQARPVPLGLKETESAGQIKIDLAFRIGSRVVVAGWKTADIELELVSGDRELGAQIFPVPRPDVAAHFKMTSADNIGFVLVAEPADKNDAIVLLCSMPDGVSLQSPPIAFGEHAALNPADLGALGSALVPLLGALAIHTPEWAGLVSAAPIASGICRSARGAIEGAAVCEPSGDGAVVGWLVHTPGTVVWLEGQDGKTYALDNAFRRFRQDVHDAVGNEFGHASREAGFIIRLPELKSGSLIRLKALSESGVHILGEVSCGALPIDPIAAARWLFAMSTPLSELHHQFGTIDEPILSALISYRQAIWDELPVTRKHLGHPIKNPKVSIIVPLYGRTDFVEHQLIEFARDPWLKEHAELIYVLDEPKLVDPFGTWAESLYRLYQQPFTWVWGSVNRGFSGANNLGADHAHGENLLFLNSDAFPQQPGWLEQLLEVLDRNSGVGAVGPRLVFADGSIQHAGMKFLRRDELGVWVNHHPYMGLDPVLDPHRELTIVPCVTGACLAIRREDFDQIGGWDTGYLIGDFEDSDLCLKLREQGKQIAYLPTVQLTHLERQSFKLLGQDDFRTRVVIYNAVRHQNRWAKFIEDAVENG